MERFGYIIAIILLFFLLFQEKCNKGNEETKTVVKEYFHSDTTLNNFVKNFKKFIPESNTIIVSSKEDSWKKRLIEENESLKDHIANIEKYINSNKDSSEKEIKLYDDSLSDENITIFTSNVVDGKMISSGVNYRLKVPKIITNTVTKEITKTRYKSQIILFGGSGFNEQGLSNVSLGLDFVTKKGFSAGGYYNMINKSYNFKFGKRIF